MKKRILLCLTALFVLLALSACGKKSGEVNVDMAKLSGDLQATITSGGLGEVAADIAASTFFFDTEKVEECKAFLNSGASACEVVIIKCKDSAYVSEVEELFKTRVKNQSDLFASYNAGEVSKLDAALIKSAGNYAVLCVTDDAAAAEKVLKDAGF